MGKNKNKRRRQTFGDNNDSLGPDTKRAKVSSNNKGTFTTSNGQKLPSSLLKFWRYRYNLFHRYDEGILIDEEGWYSVTPEVIAEDTARRVAQLHNRYNPDNVEDDYGRICVVDAFCGVGGNAIKFAEWCEHVIAIEINPERLEMARHNAKIYGVADRIEFILGDFYELAPQLKADVVFMSPPWGGVEYINSSVYDLDLMPFHTAKEWLDRARIISPDIVYFMPRNCCPKQLAALYPTAPCDIEMNYINGFFKSITIYYGLLASHGNSSTEGSFLLQKR